MQDEAGTRRPHMAFQSGYIWVALATALGAGFPLGAYLAISIGVGSPLGSSVASIIQTHGHVVPAAMWHAVPGSLRVARIAFALSGVLGWGAVACLATNLWMTAQKE